MRLPLIDPAARDFRHPLNQGGVSARVNPVPYNNETFTSRAAAESERRCVKSQAARVWGFIDSQGERGATDKEIQADLKMDGNSQRPRRVWLMRNGFVKHEGAPCKHVVCERSIDWLVAKPFEATEAICEKHREGTARGSNLV